jgi:hypothetical protein
VRGHSPEVLVRREENRGRGPGQQRDLAAFACKLLHRKRDREIGEIGNRVTPWRSNQARAIAEARSALF